MKRKVIGLLAAVSMLGVPAFAQDNHGTSSADVEMKGEGSSTTGTGGSGSSGSIDTGTSGGVNQDCFGPEGENNPNCEVGTGGSGSAGSDLGTGGSGTSGTESSNESSAGGLDDNDAASDIYRTPTGGDLGTGGSGSVPDSQDSSGDIELNGSGTGGSGSGTSGSTSGTDTSGGKEKSDAADTKDMSKSDVNIYGPTGGSGDAQDKSSDTQKSDDKKKKNKKAPADEGTGGSGSESETFKRDLGDRTPTTRPENEADRGTGSSLPEEPGTY